MSYVGEFGDRQDALARAYARVTGDVGGSPAVTPAGRGGVAPTPADRAGGPLTINVGDFVAGFADFHATDGTVVDQDQDGRYTVVTPCVERRGKHMRWTVRVGYLGEADIDPGRVTPAGLRGTDLVRVVRGLLHAAADRDTWGGTAELWLRWALELRDIAGGER